MAKKTEKNETEDILIYTGGATLREITREEWEAAGVEDQDTVTFNARNNYRVPMATLTQKAQDVLLNQAVTEFMVNEFTIPADRGE